MKVKILLIDIQKNIRFHSFCWIRVLDIICFFLETSFNFVMTHCGSSFFETSKSFWFTEVIFAFLLFYLCTIKFNNGWSNFLLLLSDFLFMLFVDVLIVYFLLFRKLLVLIVRETGVCWLKRCFFNFDFFKAFKIIFLFFNFFRNISVWNIVLS